MNAWSHLPNAKHIDSVLESIKKYTDKWNTVVMALVYNTMYSATQNVAFKDALDVVYDAEKRSVYYTAKDAIYFGTFQWESYIGARNAISALVAYDDCAHLLYSDPEEVRLLANLRSIPAILLLPACIVFNETNIKS